MALKRISKEYQEILEEKLENFSACPIQDDVFHWTATVKGPASTPYENGNFILGYSFPRRISI